jgi:hypothetical protein
VAQGLRPADRFVVDTQDAEYLAACAAQAALETKQRQREEQIRLAQEEAEDRLIGQTELIQAKYLSLPPEPEQGTTIAISVEGKRKMRKFPPEAPGEHIYFWVAAEFIAAGQTKDPEEFEVKFFDKVVDRELSLEGQKITGRVIVTVSEQ